MLIKIKMNLWIHFGFSFGTKVNFVSFQIFPVETDTQKKQVVKPKICTHSMKQVFNCLNTTHFHIILRCVLWPDKNLLTNEAKCFVLCSVILPRLIEIIIKGFNTKYIFKKIYKMIILFFTCVKLTFFKQYLVDHLISHVQNPLS